MHREFRLSRRTWLAGAATFAAVGLVGCDNVTPEALAEGLKKGCGLAGIAADVIQQLVNEGAGMGLKALINLVCSSYQNAKLAREKLGAAPPKVGEEVEFVVQINNKDIPVKATVAPAQ